MGIARTAWQAINRQARAIKDILSKEGISKSINGFKLLMLTAVGISMQESCSRFSEEACRMMIDLFDANKSGTIDVNEFVQLFNYINQWKGIFQGFDKDRSGSIDLNEFSQALQQMGYRFSQTFSQNILTKYDPRTQRLTLDNFMVVCFSLKRLTDSFKRRDREMRGQA